LKTLEKINRKGNKNSRKIEKANSAQVSPFSPGRAPSVSDGRVLPVDANQRAHSSPSLSLPRGPELSRRSSSPPPPPRPLSLTRRPHLSAVSNLPPTISPSWTRPRPRVHQPRLSPRAPFEPCAPLAHLPSLICALCPAPSPSLSLYPREQRAPPPPTNAHRLFRGRCRALPRPVPR
jgi:hypothetical protein